MPKGGLRGKSGLHEARVPGNARRGQPQGKRHREETALLSEKVRLRLGRAMVKRWGKSPPRDWQQDRHGKPHPEQCRIGASRGAGPGPWSGIPPQGCFSPRGPGWQLDPVGNGGARGMVIQPRITVRGGQNPAYRPSAHALPRIRRGKGPGRMWGRRKGGCPLWRATGRFAGTGAVSLLTLPRRWLKGGLQGFSGETPVSPWQERRLWRSRRRSRSV